ncbi:MAG: M10 family metallopeptidase C-terminal domain-containing protein, partial [Pseudomonadota bacterium]
MCIICAATNTFDPDRHTDSNPTDFGAPPSPLVTFPPTDTALVETTDAASGTSTSYVMTPADTFSGSIDSGDVSDWIAITLTAGNEYTFDALGTASFGGGTLSDTDLYLYDSSGNQLAYDDLSGDGFDAQLTWTASYTGTYYIAVDSYFTNNVGTYTLTVDEQVYVDPYDPANFPVVVEDMAEYLQTGFQGGVSFTFDTSVSNVITVNISGLTAAGQQLALWAMEAWEMVVDLDFQLVTSGGMIICDDEESGAFAYFPNTGSTATGATLNVGTGWLATYGTSIDSYSLQTYIHEFGHAIGLGHQGGYNGTGDFNTEAVFDLDSWQMSIMSYFDQNENPNINSSYALIIGAQMVDIFASQGFYGAAGAGSATAGNTTYGLNSNLGMYWDEVFAAIAANSTTSNFNNNAVAFTIYDYDGIDTLNLSFLDASTPVNLNLDGGTFSDVGSQIGVLGIALGTVIENAVTGAGNDIVAGNAANNQLTTGLG